MHPNSFLTDKQVQKIKDLWSTGLYTQQRLGKMFGINQSEVSRIVNKKRWHKANFLGTEIAIR